MTSAIFGTIQIVLEYPHQRTTLSSIKLISGSANTCGIPNYTPTFSSDEHSISHTDSYEHNNAILYDHDNEQPIFGPNPHNASTPERQKRTQGNSLKGILINTNSVKSIEKATQLKATIHYSNPDIIFLVETKLDSNYQTNSFLPPNYVAIRYRNAHGGGVLVENGRPRLGNVADIMRRTRAKYRYIVSYTKRCENDRRKRKMAESVSTNNLRDIIYG